MKRNITLLVLFVACLFVLSPLFASGDMEKASSPKKIVFMFPYDGNSAMTEWHNENIKLYQEAHPDVLIDKISSSTGDDYLIQVTTKMASGDDIDILQGWTLARMQPFAEGGRLASLNPFFEEDPAFRDFLQDSPLEATTFNGEVYGIPLELATEVIFYNKAIFRDAGVSVPSTYQEFLELIPAIRKAGYIPIGLGNSEPWTGTIPYMMIAERIGGLEMYENTVMSARGKWTDTPFVKAAEELQKWITLGAFEPNVNGIPAVEGIARFNNGEAAMFFMGSWSLPVFYEELGDDLGVFNLPTMENGRGSDSHWIIIPNQSMSIGANSNYPEIAADFLKFMLSEERQQKLAKSGIIVTTKVQLSKEEVNPVQADIIKLLGNSTGAMYPWDVPMGNALGAELNNAIANIYDGANPQKVMEDFQRISETER
ncbi:MAG: extracellular solute-binding protein [Peptostreptococcaceae bacterium]|nr:extracellular solute-binding protein [Peptostreptococcaceae bacterium]